MVIKTISNWEKKRRNSRHLSISEWDGAPTEEVSSPAHHHHGHDDDPQAVIQTVDGSSRSDTSLFDKVTSFLNGGGEPSVVPEMNLGSIQQAIEQQRKEKDKTTAVTTSANNIDDYERKSSTSLDSTSAQVRAHKLKSGGAGHTGDQQTTSSTATSSNEKSAAISKLIQNHRLQPKSSGSNSNNSGGVQWEDTQSQSDTVAPSSSASHTSYSTSSTGTNIWTKLLGGQNGGGTNSMMQQWDAKNKNVFDDEDNHVFDYEGPPSCSEAWSLWVRALWYETKHFCYTIYKNPHILFISLATFGILVGVGMAAVNGEYSAYVKKEQMNADFIVSIFRYIQN